MIAKRAAEKGPLASGESRIDPPLGGGQTVVSTVLKEERWFAAAKEHNSRVKTAKNAAL